MPADGAPPAEPLELETSESSFPELRRIIRHGETPPWLQRFVRNVGRGINEHAMIAEGDHVLVGISGGKDSLSLALALSLRRRWLPISYTVEAIHVDWREHALSASDRRALERYFAAIDVPFTSIPMSMFPPSFRGRFDCYLCARNRKRVLFDVARERGANLVAFGHHLDDIVETTLMNLCFRGEFATMNPKQPLFDGRLHIIRPLCRVTEEEIVRIADRLALPIVSIDCPLKEKNIRTVLKPMIRELHRHNPRVRQNIYRSTANINWDYLPGKIDTTDGS